MRAAMMPIRYALRAAADAHTLRRLFDAAIPLFRHDIAFRVDTSLDTAAIIRAA